MQDVRCAVQLYRSDPRDILFASKYIILVPVSLTNRNALTRREQMFLIPALRGNKYMMAVCSTTSALVSVDYTERKSIDGRRYAPKSRPPYNVQVIEQLLDIIIED